MFLRSVQTSLLFSLQLVSLWLFHPCALLPLHVPIFTKFKISCGGCAKCNSSRLWAWPAILLFLVPKIPFNKNENNPSLANS